MELIVFGLNHRTAPLEVREHWALSGDRHRATLRCLSDKIDDSEHVILCTCNRTEFYSIVPVDSSPLGPQIALSPDQTEILDGSRRGALVRQLSGWASGLGSSMCLGESTGGSGLGSGGGSGTGSGAGSSSREAMG